VDGQLILTENFTRRPVSDGGNQLLGQPSMSAQPEAATFDGGNRSGLHVDQRHRLIQDNLQPFLQVQRVKDCLRDPLSGGEFSDRLL